MLIDTFHITLTATIPSSVTLFPLLKHIPHTNTFTGNNKCYYSLHISCSSVRHSAAGKTEPVFCRTSPWSPGRPSQSYPCRSAACPLGWSTGSLGHEHMDMNSYSRPTEEALYSSMIVLMCVTAPISNNNAFHVLPWLSYHRTPVLL